MACCSGSSPEDPRSIEVMLLHTRVRELTTGRLLRSIAAGFALALAASGCISSFQAGTHSTGTVRSPDMPPTTPLSSGPTAAVATNSVTIKNFAFRPATIKVKPGTRVTWVNHDEDAHTVTFQSNLKVASDPLQGNQRYSYTFQTPGTYPYICSIHPFMRGTVIVANA
jgi:amicyanin